MTLPKTGNKAKMSTLTTLNEPIAFKWQYHLTFLVYEKESILVVLKKYLHSKSLSVRFKLSGIKQVSHEDVS